MKEWYLMDNHSPNAVSGYEGDILSDFGQSNFNDMIETTFSDSVILYNHDMSESKEIRCIIQGNHAHTMLNSMKRSGLFPIGTVKAGMYVYFDKSFWLITGCPGSNKVYEKVVMDICQYKLKWQNEKGDIVERWGNFSSASKYDDGLYEGKTINVTSDNLNILLPHDEEGVSLEHRRVFIDSKKPPKKVYVISRTDDVLFDYGEHGGILSFIADKTEFDPSKDNRELGVCDYIPKDANVEVDDEALSDGLVRCVIKGDKKLKCGFERMYVASIVDKNGNAIEWTEGYTWKVVGDVEVDSTANNNSITLCVDNEDYVDCSFKLQVLDKEEVVIAQTEITVISIF